jgi:hypothetical protein
MVAICMGKVRHDEISEVVVLKIGTRYLKK